MTGNEKYKDTVYVQHRGEERCSRALYIIRMVAGVSTKLMLEPNLLFSEKKLLKTNLLNCSTCGLRQNFTWVKKTIRAPH